MESRLSLGQIDQFLGNALVPQCALDHFAITSAALERMLQDLVALGSREIIDEARHLVGQHERQIRMRGLDLGFGSRFNVGVNRRRDVVDFIDRSRLRFLLRRRIVRLQGRHFRAVYVFENPLQFVLHPFIRPNFGRTLQQQINCVIKTPLGRFQVPGPEFALSSLVFLFGVRNKISHRIRFGLRCSLGRLGRSRLWIRYFVRRGRWSCWNCASQRRSIGLGCRQLPLALIGVARCARQKQGQQRHSQQLELLYPHVCL